MMDTVSRKFLSHREVSAQEAVYRLLSLPLVKGSRQVVFVPTDLPENRTKLLKPMKVIQELDDDEEDLYQLGILDKYQLRPDSIENICLADFAANYRYGRKIDSEPEQLDEDQIEEDLDTCLCQNDTLPKSIKLKDKSTVMTLRTKPVIVRTHQFSVLKQPEQYYHGSFYYTSHGEMKSLIYKDQMDCIRLSITTARMNSVREWAFMNQIRRNIVKLSRNLKKMGHQKMHGQI
jgi:hypothetical protein